MELILQRLALAGYGMAAVLAFVSLTSKSKLALRLTPLVAIFGGACHLLIWVLQAGSRQLPLTSSSEVLSFLTLVAVAFYLYGHWRYSLNVLGVILLPLAVVLYLVSGVLPTATLPVSEGLKDPLLLFHIAVSSLGVGALFLTFTFSVIYLAKERALKGKQPSSVFQALPSLSACDRVVYLSLVVGFALLTVGLFSAATWSANFRGSFRVWENQREILALVSWAIFGLVLYARLVRGWRGRKAALLTIAGFAAVILRLLGAPLFL